MKVSIVYKFKQKYGRLLEKIKQQCLETHPKKTALALTLGIFIGIIPIYGITFITVSSVGFIFRLNQLILQTVHILVSPLQILFIPVFINMGQKLFEPSHIHIIQASTFAHVSLYILLTQFGRLILYSMVIWLIFSVIAGVILYCILRAVLTNQLKH